jgi:S-disulfanyl-L-cysteine oxidoreductase SoxD
MRLFRRRPLAARAVAIAISVVAGQGAVAQDGRRFDVGQPTRVSELRSWNIDVGADGGGLPPGRGSVQAGKAIYETKCLACHGVEGQGQPMDRLAGGQGTLKSAKPVKTIGSYWPYATTIFDYVRRAMPLDRPQSLSPDEIYALTAYLLHLNGIVGPDATMNAQTLPMVRMPNRAAFRSDPRPDVSNTACERDCR